MSNQRETFDGWAILEILGHRRLAGWVTEHEIAGHGMIRISIPNLGEDSDQRPWASDLGHGQALVCLAAKSVRSRIRMQAVFAGQRHYRLASRTSLSHLHDLRIRQLAMAFAQLGACFGGAVSLKCGEAFSLLQRQGAPLASRANFRPVLRALGLALVSSAHFRSRLGRRPASRTASLCGAHLGARLLGHRAVLHGLSQMVFLFLSQAEPRSALRGLRNLCSMLGRERSPYVGRSHQLNGARRMRTVFCLLNQVVPVPLLGTGQAIYPGLLAHRQRGLIDHFLQNSVFENIRTIPVVGRLQMAISVPVAPEVVAVSREPHRQIGAAPNIRLAVTGVDNGIDAHPASHASLYETQALYSIIPCGKDEALAIAESQAPQPVQEWGVRSLLPDIKEAVRREIQDEVRTEYYAKLQNERRRIPGSVAPDYEDQYDNIHPPF